MMPGRTLRLLLRLLGLLLAPQDREAVLGDLLEEHSARSKETDRRKAGAWMLRQIGASAVQLISAKFARAASPSALGVAILAWLAIALLETGVNRLTMIWLSADVAYNPVAMLLTLPLSVGVSLIAARVRRDATFALAVLMVAVVTFMSLFSQEVLPAWFRVAFFLVGPLSTWTGSALQTKFWPR